MVNNLCCVGAGDEFPGRGAHKGPLPWREQSQQEVFQCRSSSARSIAPADSPRVARADSPRVVLADSRVAPVGVPHSASSEADRFTRTGPSAALRSPTRRAALVCFLRHSRLRVGHPTHPESNSQLPTSFRQKLTGDWQNASSRRSGARNTVHQAIPNKPSERTNPANGPRMPLSGATHGATVQSVPITNRQQPDAARSR